MPPSHDHSHGPDPDASPPTVEQVGRRRRAVWLMLLLLVPIGLATVLGLFLLWPDGQPTQAEQVAQTYLPPGTTYADARVVSVEPFECGTDPAYPATCAHAVVEVLEGEGKGDFQQIDIPADVYASGVAKGETVVLSRDGGAENGGTFQFYDYERSAPIVVLAILFAVVVALVARLRGLA